MVISLERCADLHVAQLMPLPLTVSCFSKIQIGFTFLVPAHLGSPGQRAVKQVMFCQHAVRFQFVILLKLYIYVHRNANNWPHIEFSVNISEEINSKP